jgi:hypothetical protein
MQPDLWRSIFYMTALKSRRRNELLHKRLNRKDAGKRAIIDKLLEQRMGSWLFTTGTVYFLVFDRRIFV